jgi:hypothetical protein
VDVPENDAVLVADGTPAVVSVQALKGEEFKGEVKRLAWSLDPKGRTLRTEIDLKNKGGRLRPGMYAYSVITVKKDCLTVPAGAVVHQGDKAFCFFVVDGKAVRTPIMTGFRDAKSVEVLKKRTPGQEGRWEEFTREDQVITERPPSLVDGLAVRAVRKS